MGIFRPRRIRLSSPYTAGFLVLLTSAAFILGGACWSAPPRYDGAGYAVLAQALLSGQGYRATDQPDSHRHGHFPPGYPFLLASTWRFGGNSVPVFHAVSVLCTLAATIASWLWFRRLMTSDAALILGLALCVNWLLGTNRRRDPFRAFLYSPLSTSRSRCESTYAPTANPSRVELRAGCALAGCLLTRHIGIALVMAVLLDRALGRRWAEASTSRL